ncbi:MAG: Uncharacterised protein [Methanobacteriota archaeon]|nr:MAG: Uncharacterised protein [Euryarchaeota archaeon]
MSGTFDKLNSEVTQPDALVPAHTGKPCCPPDGAFTGEISTVTPELFNALSLKGVSLPWSMLLNLFPTKPV